MKEAEICLMVGYGHFSYYLHYNVKPETMYHVIQTVYIVVQNFQSKYYWADLSLYETL